MEASYRFTEQQLNSLGALVILPHDERMKIMADNFGDKPLKEIFYIFSNFIDMAQTVIKNVEEQAIMCAITEWGVDPNQVEKINMPSLFGAIEGYKAAHDVPPDNLCHGCAFRKGSVANTCLTTVTDTTYCEENEENFFCHENLENGEPTQKCRGFLKKKVGAK